MKRVQKGSVTIYLALIMSVMLSLFLTVIEGARQNAISMEAECAFDLAVYSVFAEYNRALYERYHLLFIDTSYEKQQGSLTYVEEHLAAHVRMNLSEGNKAVRTADLTKTFLEDAAVLEASYATDEDAKVFERQAVLYMKAKYGLSCMEDLQKEFDSAERLELFTKDIDGQRNANQAIIDEAELPEKETGEVDEEGNPITEPIELENPADSVNGSRPSGVLLLVTDMDEVISSKSITGAAHYSGRGVKVRGAGLAGRKDLSAAEKLLFNAYILEHCGNYTNVKQDSGLDYQMEYIIAGKESDKDNLKAVVQRLLMLREVSNLTYLFTDKGKVAEAEALAASVAAAAGVPYLTQPIKISLLFAWAYAESVYDVKQLLKGNRVKLVKEQTDWHYSLQGMLGYAEDIAKDAGDVGQSVASLSTDKGQTGIGLDTVIGKSKAAGSIKDGLSYQEYLMLFIMAKQENEKVARVIDLIEADIRLTGGNGQFQMNDCVDALSMEASVGSQYGYSVKAERIFYYQ